FVYQQVITNSQPLHGQRVAAGFRSSCAVDGAGAVWCWGDLGGQKNQVATQQTQFTAQVNDVHIYWTHACALLTDGRVACWGDNAAGESGYPPCGMCSSSTPHVVPLQ